MPVAIVVLPVIAKTVTESTDPQGRHLDFAGVALGGALLAIATFAFTEAGRPGVAQPVAAGCSVVLAVAFVAVERAQQHPMLPLALFRRPGFAVGNAAAAAMNLATVGLLFVFNLYLQDVLHYPALAAGLALVPLYLPLCLLAPIGGRIIARTGPKGPMIAGLLAAAAGAALLIPLQASSGYPAMLPGLLLWGTGLGMLTPAVVAAAVAAVPGDRAGLASAVNNTARQAATAIGVAGLGAIAGPPTASGFLTGFRYTALTAATLLAASAAAAAAFLPADERLAMPRGQG